MSACTSSSASPACSRCYTMLALVSRVHIVAYAACRRQKSHGRFNSARASAPPRSRRCANSRCSANLWWATHAVLLCLHPATLPLQVSERGALLALLCTPPLWTSMLSVVSVLQLSAPNPSPASRLPTHLTRLRQPWTRFVAHTRTAMAAVRYEHG